jgi:hypothetical protein
MKELDDLRRRLASAGRACDLAPGGFGAAAARCLEEAFPSEGRARVAREILLQSGRLPAAQLPLPDERLGQPPQWLVLLREQHFEVVACFQLDGSPAIEDHAGEGAFCLLAGAAVESRYAFTATGPAQKGALLGELRPLGSELLPEGSCRPFLGGGRTIHARFVLHRPSLVVEVRDWPSSVQRRYHRSGIAGEVPGDRSATLRRLQPLRWAAATDLDLYREMACQAIAGGDAFFALEVLRDGRDRPGTAALAPRLTTAVREHFGALAEPLLGILAADADERALRRIAKAVFSEELRLFTALLASVPTASAFHRLVKGLYPEEDVERRVLGWIAALAGHAATGEPPAAPDRESPALGVRLQEGDLEIIYCLLRGQGQGETEEHLAALYGVEQVAASRRELEDSRAALLQFPLLKVLFPGVEANAPLPPMRLDKIA